MSRDHLRDSRDHRVEQFRRRSRSEERAMPERIVSDAATTMFAEIAVARRVWTAERRPLRHRLGYRRSAYAPSPFPCGRRSGVPNAGHGSL
jgi:hypothetical protein